MPAGLRRLRQELRELLLGAVRGRQPALGDHAVEDEVPPLGGLLEVLRGVPPRRRLDGAGEHRALGHREVLDVLAEVRLARRLDPVRAAAQVDDVQVVLEDLVLALLLGDLDREDDLLVLAQQRHGVLPGGDLHVLLGDGRAAADPARGLVPQRTADTREVEAGVGVERPVFGRQHGLPHVLGDLVERDDRAVDVVGPDGGQRGAVGVLERGHLRDGGLVRRRHVEHHPAHEERHHRREQAQADQPHGRPQHPARPAAAASRAVARGRTGTVVGWDGAASRGREVPAAGRNPCAAARPGGRRHRPDRAARPARAGSPPSSTRRPWRRA